MNGPWKAMLITVAVVVVAKALPDITRYIRMNTM